MALEDRGRRRLPAGDGQMPSPDFSRHGSGAGHAGRRRRAGWPTPRRRPVSSGRSASSTVRPARHQRLVVEVARAEAAQRLGRGAGHRQPERPSRAARRASRARRRPPRSRRWRAPRRRPAARASGPRSRTTHPGQAPACASPPTAVGPEQQAAARRGAAASSSARLEPHARHGRREAWGSRPAGAPSALLQPRPTPRRPAPARAPRASPTVSPGSSRGRSSSASARRERRLVERPGEDRARHVGLAGARARRTDLSAPGRDRRAVGQVGARQVVGEQRGVEVLQGAQPDDREASARRAGRRRPSSGGRERRGPGHAHGASAAAGSAPRRRRSRSPGDAARGTTRARAPRARGRAAGVGVVRARAPRAAAAPRRASRPGPARSPARRSCPGDRCRPPTPLATTVTAPALGQAERRARGRPARRRPPRRRGSQGRASRAFERLPSTGQVLHVESALEDPVVQHAWRTWSP